MGRNYASWPTQAILVLAPLWFVGGCGKKLTRTMVPASSIQTLDARSPYLKAHLADGGVYVLSEWHVDETMAIVGDGSLLDVNRTEVTSGHFVIPADSVVLFETNVEGGSGASIALTVMAGVTAAVAGICLADPKTCFGSCPTFYAPNESGELEIQAEGFSSSIAPGLEATDVDMLLHSRPTERDFTIRLTNEALETHVIRGANLLAVPRPPGGRVFMTSDGVFRSAFDPISPTRCLASNGECLRSVSAADRIEQTSLADSADLATREVIDLEFTQVPEGDLGLVVVSRQTLMTTFLIYQALAYMGENASRWLATLGTGGEGPLDRARGIGRVLGNIDVQVMDRDGDWVLAGSTGETGPIAADTRMVPLPRASGAPLRVRLRLTQGMWRLDQVALVRLGSVVEPERISPNRVTRQGRTDPNALRVLVEPDSTLVTLPGDEYEIFYQLPSNPPGYELFLEATGYYLEWMRQEWMAEEDPLRAAQLLLNPTGAMKALAPVFKETEPRIERLFWNSRYVRK